VAALAVYVPAEDWGDGGIVNWLRDEMNSHPEYIPGFLELLAVLPEVHKKSCMFRIYICDLFRIF
jgi:transportin-3